MANELSYRRPDSIGAGAPADEIEITAEMIEAGSRYLADTYSEVNDWLTNERAKNVFEAMIDAAPSGYVLRRPPLHPR
jgi:hypothetical protein